MAPPTIRRRRLELGDLAQLASLPLLVRVIVLNAAIGLVPADRERREKHDRDPCRDVVLRAQAHFDTLLSFTDKRTIIAAINRRNTM
jgi:hypothetical protein